jgi:hypothetical protein
MWLSLPLAWHVSDTYQQQAYLFRAALAELRAEVTTYYRKESADVWASTSSIRREVDLLDGKMKQTIDSLKHELVLLLQPVQGNPHRLQDTDGAGHKENRGQGRP